MVTIENIYIKMFRNKYLSIRSTVHVYIYISGDLARAIRTKTDLHFGTYHSLYEWFNPMYLEDKRNKFKTQTFVEVSEPKEKVRKEWSIHVPYNTVVYTIVMDLHPTLTVLRTIHLRANFFKCFLH